MNTDPAAWRQRGGATPAVPAETTAPTRIARRAGKALALGLGGAVLLLPPLLHAPQAAAQSQQPAPAGAPAVQTALPKADQPAMPATDATRAIGAAPAAAEVRIFEWINRRYAADQVTSVMAAPSDTAGTIGRLRPGVDVLVVGLVAGGQWLQVRLPDGATVGYVRAADFPTALGEAPAARTAAATPGATSGGQAAPEPPPPSSAPPAVISAPPAASAAAAAAPAGPAAPWPSEPGSAEPGAAAPATATVVVAGHPTVIDTATLEVGDRLVALFGLNGLDGDPAAGLQQFIAGSGDSVTCQPQDARRYVCLLPDGTDLGMAALINGAALLGADAPDSYRDERNDAVRNRRGVWASTSIPAFVPPADLPPELFETYLAWTMASPLWPVEALGDGGYFIDGVPYGWVDGAPRAFWFDRDRGAWGFHDRDGRWHDAPGRLRAHLDLRHPRGAGLRMDALRHDAGIRRDFGRAGAGGHEAGMRREPGREGFHAGGGFHQQFAAHGFMQPHAGGMGHAGGRAGGMGHAGGGGRGGGGKHK